MDDAGGVNVLQRKEEPQCEHQQTRLPVPQQRNESSRQALAENKPRSRCRPRAGIPALLLWVPVRLPRCCQSEEEAEQGRRWGARTPAASDCQTKASGVWGGTRSAGDVKMVLWVLKHVRKKI